MIRFFLTVLIFHFSFSLISCTSKDVEDNPDAVEEGAANGAIDENEISDTAATHKSGGEDDLESELSEEKPAEAAPPSDAVPEEKTAEAAPPADDLEKDISAQEVPPAAEAAPPAEVEAPPPVADAPPAAPEKAKVRDIRYMSNANGGTVVIETSKPVAFQTRLNPATQQFVIELADVELPQALQRPYNMKEFGSRFGSVNAYQSAGSSTARIVIQLAGSSGEPIVQQEGTSLVVIPPAPAEKVATATPEPGIPAPERVEGKEGALAAKTLEEFLSGSQKFYGKPISLQTKDADVRDVVNFLAEESGANIVMSDDVTGKISLKLRKIPWDQALVTVMRSKGLGYARQGNVLRISTMKNMQAESEIATKLIESQKSIAPNVVQVIPISYSDMGDLMKTITPFLTQGSGKAVADTRSSTLIITDRAEAIDRIMKLVKTLDIPPAQVSIESKIVEAVEGFANFVGVNWGMSGSPVALGSSGVAPVDLGLGMSSASLNPDLIAGSPFSANLQIGTLDVLGTLSATLTLAEQDSLAKVITAPRISTMNREKSTIVQQGENVAVVTTRSETTGSITKSEKRTPFKLQLEVTPQVTADGGVIMDLDVQREFLGPVTDQETQSRAVNSRKAKTKVLVRNGQTAVIGGIMTSDETEQNTGIPGLKNLPIIGWLFKSRSFTRDKNELLIFMTPRILASQNAANEQAANR